MLKKPSRLGRGFLSDVGMVGAYLWLFWQETNI